MGSGNAIAGGMIMKIFSKIKAFVEEHKEDKTFKYTVIIVVLIILAIAVNIWRDCEDRKEITEQQTAAVQVEETEEINPLEEIWEESKFHFLTFAGLTAALTVIQIRKSLRLEQTERKVEK